MRFVTHFGNNSRKSSSSRQRDYCPPSISATPLRSVFEFPGHFSSMSQTLGKRERELESLQDSIDVGEPKRFHIEETDWFLLQLGKTLTDEDEEEECAPSEELVNGIMRSLEEEIAATCSTSYLPSNSQDNSMASDIFTGQESQTLDSDSGVDLSYLLEASDDDLGIPPSPVLDLKHEVCPSSKEPAEVLSETPYLKSLGENWHFEDSFDNYQQFPVYEDAWDASQLQDYINRDFVSQSMLFDGDFPLACRLGTAGGM